MRNGNGDAFMKWVRHSLHRIEETIMLVEMSLSKKELARYRDKAARFGISVESMISDAVGRYVVQESNQGKR